MAETMARVRTAAKTLGALSSKIMLSRLWKAFCVQAVEEQEVNLKYRECHNKLHREA